MSISAKAYCFSRLFQPMRSSWLKNGVVFRCATTTKWNKDWKPGPYPRTEEECRAAAKKYNLIPEDYKPFPEEEGFGDYPDLPPVSAAARNPYEKFDYPYLRRNYGEPLHVDFDMLTEDKLNVEQKLPMSLWRIFFVHVGIVIFFTSFAWCVAAYPPESITGPKQYPYEGIKHYTFEPLTAE